MARDTRSLGWATGRALTAAAVLLAISAASLAATKTWNNAANGSWNTPGNWSGATKAGSAEDVIFDNSAVTIPTITLDAAQSANSLTFGSSTGTALGAFTLQANASGATARTLTLTTGNITMGSSVTGTVTFGTSGNGILTLVSSAAGFQIVNNNTTQMLDINAVISGSLKTLSLNSAGGVIRLSGANIATGAATVGATTSGTLVQLNNAAALSTFSGVTISSGSAVDFNGQAAGAAKFTLNGTGIGGGGVLYNSTGSSTDSGAITVSSASTIKSSGTLMTLTGAIALGANALTVDGAGNTTLSTGVISGSGGSLFKNGSGALLLSGANTFTGGVTLNAGTLNINANGTAGSNGPLGNGGAFVINGGTIDNTSGAARVVANVNPVTLGASLAFSTSAGTALNNLTLPGAVTIAADRTITLNGTGALAFSGLWTNTADSVRTLTVTNGAGASSASLLTIGSLNLTGAGSTAARTDVINGTGNVTVTGVVGNGVSALSGLTYSGSGTLTLGGANTFTGGLNVQSGTVKLNNATAASSGLVTIGSAGTSGTLDLNGASRTVSSLATGGTAANQVILNNGAALGTLSYNGNNVTTFGGTIQNGSNTTALTLAANAATVLTLSGNNSYNGATNITTGKIIMGSSTALGGSAVTVASGGALDINGFTKGATIAGVGIAGATGNNIGALLNNGAAANTSFTMSAAATVGGSGDMLLADGDGGPNISYTGAGPWALTKAGSGTLYVGVNNTDNRGYLPSTIINNGKVVVGGAFALGSGNIAVNGATSTLDINAQGMLLNGSGQVITLGTGGTLIDSVGGGGVMKVTVGASGGSIGGSGGTWTIGGPLVLSTNSLTKVGTDTVTLSDEYNGGGANTGSGTITVNAGTLNLNKSSSVAVPGGLTVGDGVGGANADVVRLGSSTQIVTTSAVTLNSSGLLDLNGNSNTIGTLTMNGGSVTTGGGTLTLGGNVTGNANAAAAAISGNLSVGGATRTFTIASNSVAGGDMQISAAIASVGTFGITKAGAGVLNLSAANGYTGTTTLSAGTLIASNVQALGNAAALALNGGTLDLATDSSINAYNTTVGGSVTVQSDRATSGAGTTHTLGTLSIGAQTLNLTAGANVASGTAGLTFGTTTLSASGATFNTAAGTNLTLGVLSGSSKNFTVQGSGQVTLNTASSRTGTTTLSGGTLMLGSTSGLGAATATFTLNCGTLDLATDTTVNAYPTTVGGSVTILSDRATGGTGVTQTLGALTFNGGAGSQDVYFAPGANVTGGTAGLTFGATSISAADNVRLNVASGMNLTLGALTGNTGVTFQGAGKYTFNGSSSGRIDGNSSLSGGTAVLSTVNGLGAVGSGTLNLYLLNGETLDLATNTTVNAYNINATDTAPVTIASDKAAASAGITHTLGTLALGANQLNVTAGANVSGGSPVVAFGATTLTATGCGASTLNPTTANASLTAVTGSATAGNTDTLGLDGTSTANTLTGVIADGSSGGNVAVTKSNSGTWTLSGANAYSGATTIHGGALALGLPGSFAYSPTITVGDAGSSGASLNLTAKTAGFHILSGQTLGGIGSVVMAGGQALTVDPGAHWAPGNSIGANFVTGNLTLSGAADFQLGNSTGSGTHASPFNSDQTQVSGALALGGTLNLLDNAAANGNGAVAAGCYKIFNYGSLNAAFAGINNVSGYHAKVVDGGAGTGSGQGLFVENYQLASANAMADVALGNFHAGSSSATVSRILTNAGPAAYGEGLGVSSATTGGAAVSGVPGSLLAGGGSAALAIGATPGAGDKTGTVVLTLNSDGTGTSGYGETSAGTVTVHVSGTGFALAEGSLVTPAPVAFGNVFAGSTVTPRDITIKNAAADDGYSEKLNAAVGPVTGGAQASGAFDGLGAQGASSALKLWVDATTAGKKDGAVIVVLHSDGTGTSELGVTALNGLEVAVTGNVYDHASGSFDQTKKSLLAINLGQWDLASGPHTVPFSMHNLSSTAGYTAGLALTGITATGDTAALGSDMVAFANLAAGAQNDYLAHLLTDTMGDFSATYVLHMTDAAGIDGTPRTEDLTLVLSGTVTPEPATMALTALGALAVLLRRKRK